MKTTAGGVFLESAAMRGLCVRDITCRVELNPILSVSTVEQKSFLA